MADIEQNRVRQAPTQNGIEKADGCDEKADGCDVAAPSVEAGYIALPDGIVSEGEDDRNGGFGSLDRIAAPGRRDHRHLTVYQIGSKRRQSIILKFSAKRYSTAISQPST
jgi:hypothetical protein